MKKTFYLFTKERPCCRSLQDVSNLYDAIEIRLLFLLWSVSPVPCSPDRRMVARSDYRGRQKRNCQGIDRAYHPQLCSHYCHDHSCILRREFVVNLGLLNNDDSNRHLLFYSCARRRKQSCIPSLFWLRQAWGTLYTCSFRYPRTQKDTLDPKYSLLSFASIQGIFCMFAYTNNFCSMC